MSEVKICGTTSMMDVNNAIRAGADAIGVITHSRRHTRHTVDPHRAAWFVRSTPESVTSVLVPRSTNADEIIDMAERIQPDRVQLGESEDPVLTEALHGMKNRPSIAQVIHVSNETTPEVVDNFLGIADIIHLDTAGERPGGNGVTHDWEISREITNRAHSFGKLVLLAGGLTGENVAEAIRTVRPDGVDVETGIKDSLGAHEPLLVKKFVASANTAFELTEMVG
jgi:phosphoribosylanthranilate isomerase